MWCSHTSRYCLSLGSSLAASLPRPTAEVLAMVAMYAILASSLPGEIRGRSGEIWGDLGEEWGDVGEEWGDVGEIEGAIGRSRRDIGRYGEV